MGGKPAASSLDEKICGVDLKRGDAGGFFHTDRAKDDAPASAPASAPKPFSAKGAKNVSPPRAPASQEKRGKRSKSPVSASKAHAE